MIVNFILFQLAWFSCVIGAAKGVPWLGVLVSFYVVGVHIYQAKQVKQELLLVLIVLLIGAIIDQAMLTFELIDYMNGGWIDDLVPVWILALWLGFSTILNVSLRWMRGRYFTAIIFGAVGGPLAYFSAEKIGAVILHGQHSYIALSIAWAVITPLLLVISSYFDGYSPQFSAEQIEATNVKNIKSIKNIKSNTEEFN